MNRILLVEDNPNDAELIEAMLAGAGVACTWERVETREAFVEALERGTFDLILSDYSLPPSMASRRSGSRGSAAPSCRSSSSRGPWGRKPPLRL
jgi:CheY-like chemotaxis protein